MYAFVAILWSEDAPQIQEFVRQIADEVSAAHPHTERRFLAPGVILFDLGSYPYSETIHRLHSDSPAQGGAVFGTIFRASNDLEPSTAVDNFSPEESEAIFNSNGDALIHGYWGHYIAFLRAGCSTVILTDPTSSIPCYLFKKNGVTVLFSHLEKCPYIWNQGLSFNLKFISALLAYDKIQNGETGFSEIQEILGGSKVVLDASGNSSITQVWRPAEFALRPQKLSDSDGVKILRDTVRYVVRSWANVSARVHMNLSGGLDSTIVLNCLAESNAEVTAYHHIAASGDLSEVKYARFAAEHSGVRLVELTFSASMDFPEPDCHPLSVRPTRKFLAPNMSRHYFGNSSDERVPIFTGQGGDHLFHIARTPLGFLDHISDNGLGGDAVRELFNSAQLAGKTIWEVASIALAHRRRPLHTTLMLRNIRNNATPFSRRAHQLLSDAYCVAPWMDRITVLPPAKQDHLSTLMHMAFLREVLDEPVTRNYVHPLISQPLIELAMRLPVYSLCANGVSRGLVRTAFKDDIPEAISKRMTKGGSIQYFMGQVDHNRAMVERSLQDGQLVRLGLVDEDDVRAFMKNDWYRTNGFGHRILSYYSIEAWLTSWSSRLPGIHAHWTD